MSIRGVPTLIVLGLLGTGCASVPTASYFAAPGDPATKRMGHTLQRAAFAAGDDTSRYSFAFVSSAVAAVYSDEDATFYVTDGLMRLPAPVLDAVVAHEVAHEVLGHVGSRRRRGERSARQRGTRSCRERGERRGSPRRW